jgi:hypothetical protein
VRDAWKSHTNQIYSKFCCITHILSQIFPLFWFHYNANKFFIDEMKLGELRRQPGAGWEDLITLKHNATLTGEQPRPTSIHTEKGGDPHHIRFCAEEYRLVIPNKGFSH